MGVKEDINQHRIGTISHLLYVRRRDINQHRTGAISQSLGLEEDISISIEQGLLANTFSVKKTCQSAQNGSY
jgi:hypothetical protein